VVTSPSITPVPLHLMCLKSTLLPPMRRAQQQEHCRRGQTLNNAMLYRCRRLGGIHWRRYK